MFSQRTHWDQQPNPLSRAWAARTASGLPCWDMTESNPTRCGFCYPEAEIRAALASPRGLTYEPTPKGLPAARRAVAEELEGQESARDGNSPCSPDAILLTASTSEAYAWLFKLLCDRGDQLLIPRPSYPLFDFLARLEDIGLLSYSLRYLDRWRVDFEGLEAAITPRVRAVLAVHPNNPTGSLFSSEEAGRMRSICAGRGLALISDEVFLDYALAPPSAAGVFAGSLALDSPCLTFSLGGLSKAAGLPQIKVGWIRLGGPERLVEEALARLEIVADTYLSVNTPAQWALPELLRTAGTVRGQIRERTARNRAYLEERREKDPAAVWELLKAEGGWYAILRVPEVLSEEQWCLRLAEEEGVLLHPGFFFDFEREAYLVASLLPEEERFREAMDRTLTFLEAAVRRQA